MESQHVELQYQNLVFNLVEMVLHLRLPKRMVINSDATHTKMDLTKTWLFMDMEVMTMRFQNLLMKIQNIIDPKVTTVILKVFFRFCFWRVLAVIYCLRKSLKTKQ